MFLLKKYGVLASLLICTASSLFAEETPPTAQPAPENAAKPADAPKEVSADPVTLYVAPNGNDEWSGQFAEPNAAGNDGPCATLEGVRNVIRKMREAGRGQGPVTVQIRQGIYSLTQNFVLEPQDSGKQDAPITYMAYTGEKPIISGGKAITGWKQEGNLWVADVPELTKSDWRFSSLYINGQRRSCARTPNEGYFHTAGKAPASENSATGEKILSNKTAFVYKPGDLKRFEDMDDALVVVLHAWETSFHHISAIDEEKHIVTFRNASEWPFENWGPLQRYYVENTFEALDAPGEWYANVKTGKVYYYPMSGDDMTKAEVIVPVQKQLFSLDGNPGSRQFVDYVNIQGLKFQYVNSPIGPEGYADAGSAVSVPAAIQLRGTRYCTLTDCEFAHLDNYGIWLRVGCISNKVVHNNLNDLGAGGIRIGERQRSSDALEVSHNIIDNNLIYDGGHIYKSGVGIWIGQSPMNTITHNEVADMSNTGISIGWAWNPDQDMSYCNYIAYNHVHHIGRAEFSNMAGIYVLGGSGDSQVVNNLIHDVLAFQYGGWGIHSDEGTSHLVVENNVAYNTTSGGYDQYYGVLNRVRNNIFAFSSESQVSLSNARTGIPVQFERNILLTNNGIPFGANWEYAPVWHDGNCYWDIKGWDLDFRGKDFKEWQKTGNDIFGTVADPLFENAEAGDFRLKPESPVLALGFCPIDTTQAGLYGEATWKQSAKEVQRQASITSETFTPKPVQEDFENLKPGENPPGTTMFGITGKANIEVTEETAANGSKHSLKFTDTEGPQEEWQPEMCYTARLNNGLCTTSFDVKIEKGAILQHDWRSDWTGHRVGPRLTFKEGKLMLGDEEKAITEYPEGEWFHVEIECGLGKAAKTPATYTLTITAPGKEPQKFEDLPCLYSKFRSAERYWFLSSAKTDAVYYLDNISIQVK